LNFLLNVNCPERHVDVMIITSLLSCETDDIAQHGSLSLKFDTQNR